MDLTLTTQSLDDYKPPDKSQILCLMINYFHDELIEQFCAKQVDSINKYLALIHFIVQNDYYVNDSQLIIGYQHKVTLMHLLINTWQIMQNEDSNSLWTLKNLILTDSCNQCLQFHIDVQLYQESIRKLMAFFLINDKINDEDLKKKYEEFLKEDMFDYSVYSDFNIDQFHASLLESLSKIQINSKNLNLIFKLLSIINSKCFNHKRDNSQLLEIIDKFCQELLSNSSSTTQKIFTNKSQNTTPVKELNKRTSFTLPDSDDLCFDLNYNKNNCPLIQSTQKPADNEPPVNIPEIDYSIAHDQSSPPIELVGSLTQITQISIDDEQLDSNLTQKKCRTNDSARSSSNTTKSSIKLKLSESEDEEQKVVNRKSRKKSRDSYVSRIDEVSFGSDASANVRDKSKDVLSKENKEPNAISDTDLEQIQDFNFKKNKQKSLIKSRREALKSKKLLESSSSSSEEEYEQSDGQSKEDTPKKRTSTRLITAKKSPKSAEKELKRESLSSTGRTFWTDNETAWLVYGHSLYANDSGIKKDNRWSNILSNFKSKFKSGRTNVNLKDRWRSISKKPNEFARYQKMAEMLKSQNEFKQRRVKNNL